MSEQNHINCWFCTAEASKANQNQALHFIQTCEDFAMRQLKLLRVQTQAKPVSKLEMLLSNQVRTCTGKFASVYSH